MPLREDTSLAWMHLFGKNTIPTSTPTTTTDRVVAVGCAMRIAPASVVASGAFDAGGITEAALRFEGWLGEADNEQDAQIRRMLLVMVCEKADEKTPHDRIRALVKELHRYVTHG